MSPLLIQWHSGTFRILTRVAGVMAARHGLITDDGVWGIHLDGYHVDLTHIPTGKRLWRFRQLGPAVEALRDVLAVSGVEWNTTKVMTDDTTLVHIELILRQHDGVAV